VLYAPVSAHDQGADLDQQVARPAAWATDQGVAVAEVVCGGRLGHERQRSKLRRLLADRQMRVIVVEHSHRLARFGVEHLEAAFSARAARSWPPIRARPPTTWCGT